MRIAGIILTCIGVIGGAGLLADGEYYNGIVGGLIFVVPGIIMILKGKSRAEVKAIKEVKRKNKQEERIEKLRIKEEVRARVEQEKEEQKKRRQFEEDTYNSNSYPYDDPEYARTIKNYYDNLERIKNNASVLYNLGVQDGKKWMS